LSSTQVTQYDLSCRNVESEQTLLPWSSHITLRTLHIPRQAFWRLAIDTAAAADAREVTWRAKVAKMEKCMTVVVEMKKMYKAHCVEVFCMPSR
jgi:hypothetical protein